MGPYWWTPLLIQMLLDDFVPEQAAAFLVLLRAKVTDPQNWAFHLSPPSVRPYPSSIQGETPGEIAGLARAMLDRGLKVSTGMDGEDKEFIHRAIVAFQCAIIIHTCTTSRGLIASLFSRAPDQWLISLALGGMGSALSTSRRALLSWRQQRAQRSQSTGADRSPASAGARMSSRWDSLTSWQERKTRAVMDASSIQYQAPFV